MTATRERAINLRDWEVKAIQAGRLKMLVRPVKVNLAKARGGLVLTGYLDQFGDGFGGLIVEDGKLWHRNTYEATLPEHDHAYLMPCPFGQPGDRLRGREAAAINDTGRPAARYHFNAHVKYKADGLNINFDVDLKHWRTAFENNALRYQSSIHMPRWAVRNWLEITEVRCGRVREMSEEEAWMTGVEQTPGTYTADFAFHGFRDSHSKHYDADHGAGAWERDWVWMIGVKRIEGGV